MSGQKTPVASAPLQSGRKLDKNFTALTLRRAVTAKRRATIKQQIRAFFKEPFSMKSLTFLRTAPGVVLATAIIATTGVSAYALTNWFNADVTVTQNDSVLSVDLSQCQGNLPPGVEPTYADKHNVQFKITGNPHISAQDIQQKLLGACESSAVTEFYAKLFPAAGLSSTGHPAAGVNHAYRYALLPGVVESIDGTTATIRSTGAKSNSFGTRTFTLASDVTSYNAGEPTSVSDVNVGDNVMFLAYTPDAADVMTEGVSVLDSATVQIVSVFKTQYNDGTASSFDYQSSNVMPLDSYNQMRQ